MNNSTMRDPSAVMKPGVPGFTRLAGRRTVRRVGYVARTILVCFVGLFFLSPLFWMFSSALKPLNEVFTQPIQWIPHPFVWGNISAAVHYFPFVHDLTNTLIITVPSVVGTVFSNAMIAYGITRVRWRFSNPLFSIILATMMIPSWTTVIPLFILFSHMQWVNTFWPLIIPNFFGSGFSVFLLRQFLLQQPNELYDAAFIDGAGHGYSFLNIALPLAKPALAVVGLFAFIGSWTDFFNPLIYLSSPSKFTLMLGLQSFQSQHTTFWNYSMAANAIVLLPILILFFLAQRTFIEGIKFTGLRG